MRAKVLIPQDVAEIGKTYLRDHGLDAVVTGRTDIASLLRDAADCDAILARLTPYPAELFEAAPRLRIVARHGVGVNNIDTHAAARHGVWVTNTPGVNANPVAEHAIMLMLSCAKDIIRQDAGIKRGSFSGRESYVGLELRGRTLGIVGYGSIGRLTAEKARFGLGMDVLALVRRVPEGGDGIARFTDDLNELLERSDVVSLHIPSSPGNRRMFGAEQFRRMRPGALFINTARGDLVDEAALYDALSTGHLRAAGIDVWETEPVSASNPILTLPNVIATPHEAAFTKECLDAMSLGAAEEIVRVLTGQRPLHPVNEPLFLR